MERHQNRPNGLAAQVMQACVVDFSATPLIRHSLLHMISNVITL